MSKRTFSQRSDADMFASQTTYKAKRPKMSTAPAVKKYVKKAIMAEKEPKYVDDLANPLNVDYAGTLDALSHKIVTGDTDTTRDGSEVTMTAIRMKGHWLLGDANNTCRVIIFQWHNNSALIAPSVGDILTTVGAIGAATALPYHNTNNFRILYDRIWELNAGAGQSASFDFTLRGSRLGRKKILFNAGGVTCQNGLYLLTISDSAATTHPSIIYDLRQEFVDT